MGLAQPAGKIPVADYLAGELVSDNKHEYIDGEVYAMAGTSRRHNQIAGNLYSRLNEHLRGGPCTAFISDLKVSVPAGTCFYYPDVVVTCDTADDEEYYLTRPVLISRSAFTEDVMH